MQRVPSPRDPHADLCGYDEAARYLRVSKRHVQQLVADRRLAHIRIGRRIWFRLEDLEAFVEVSRIPAIERL